MNSSTKKKIGIAGGFITAIATGLDLIANSKQLFFSNEDKQVQNISSNIEVTEKYDVTTESVNEGINDIITEAIKETEKAEENKKAEAVITTIVTAENRVKATLPKEDEDEPEIPVPEAPVTELPQEAADPVPEVKEELPYAVRELAQFPARQDFNDQCYAVDIDDNALYYLRKEERKINRVDLYSGDETTVVDLTGANNISLFERMAYNPFNGIVYGFAFKDGSTVYFDVNNQETSKYHFSNPNYGLYFTGADTIACLTKDSASFTKITYIEERSLANSAGSKGYIFSQTEGKLDEWNIPFLHDENYYWLQPLYNKVYVTYTGRLCFSDTSYDSSLKQVIGEFDGIAANVYNNEAYIMKNDLSIYRVNIDKLWEINENKKTDINKLTESASSNTDNALELYISGNQIRQTGLNNINKVSGFSLTGSGGAVVFDKYDNKFKLIEKK